MLGLCFKMFLVLQSTKGDARTDWDTNQSQQGVKIMLF